MEIFANSQEINSSSVHYLEWEKFDYFYWKNWMGAQWQWSLIISSVYVGLIFGLKCVMRGREPLKLRRLLLGWNLFLAIYSIASFTRTFPDLVSVLSGAGGFHNATCSRVTSTRFVFWEFIFAISKVVELGDTVFIVLRKQPLIFLHWYHHISVLMYTWFSYDSSDPGHQYGVNLNTGIHALMYSYYATKTLGVKVPKAMALCLTLTQTLQMLVGVYVNLYTIYVKSLGISCHRTNANILTSSVMYASYFILFFNFFYNSYLKSKEAASRATKTKQL